MEMIEYPVPCGRKASYRWPCARFRRANARLGWEQSGLEPSWGQYTMDLADRINEHEEALEELPHYSYLRLLASHFIINAITKYGFSNQG